MTANMLHVEISCGLFLKEADTYVIIADSTHEADWTDWRHERCCSTLPY